MAPRTTRRTELAARTVDELRDIARERGISGSSRMRKAELVEAIGSAGARKRTGPKKTTATKTTAKKTTAKKTGAKKTGSTRYAQEITSTGDRPERPGRSLVTRDHDVIRRWAEERDATPATIEGTEHEGRAGVLRFDFPGGASGGNLVHIDWDDWFTTFDARQLNFIYQEERSDRRQSNFFRLENPDREDA
jgi:hypothetical protein